jgi:hypothetical protein
MLGTEDLAALAAKIREQTDLTPERAAFLNRIAAEVRSGTYTVDVDGLASKLMDELLRRPDDSLS